MSKKDAIAYAASLAATLMVPIIVFQAGDGTHEAIPSDEYDGDGGEQRPMIYDSADVARAGVFVKLDRDGSLAVYRGYVRLDDELREETAVQDGDGADAMGQGADVGLASWKPSATSAGGPVITSGGQSMAISTR